MKYYEIKADNDGVEEVLFGSFVRGDCVYELAAEKDYWKNGCWYKNIRIVSRETDEKPDADVYSAEELKSLRWD